MEAKRDWAADAAQHRQRAAGNWKARDDSFERSDTDGFLSQWASGMTAQLETRKAEICEQEGRDRFLGLYEGDRRVKARMISNQYGHSWLLDDAEAERYGRKFLPTGENSRIQKQLGLRERPELAPAWATMAGRGTGLSGSCWVTSFRTGDKWGSDAELIED